MSHKRIIT